MILNKDKMKSIKTLLVGAIILASTFPMYSQSIGDIVGSMVEGVFTKTDLTVKDLIGEYTSEGPAVTFKSENLLQKAGGIAGATSIESQLKPYYEQYGLNNMTLTIDEEANFTMKIKSLSLKGTVTKNNGEEGTFDFNFNVMGIKLGKFTAYIEKSGRTMKLMFDATKLKSFISTVGKFTGNSMATALASILDSYDGACIGWRMQSTAEATNNAESAISNGIGSLKDILKGGK